MDMLFHPFKAFCLKIASKVRMESFRSSTCSGNLKKTVRGLPETKILEAARCADDKTLLIQIARKAADPSVRLEAALAVPDQAALTAIALREWSIERGKKAVACIENGFLLRRIAGSASQDSIRLYAAEKLNDEQLIGRVAEGTADVILRWKAARKLKDPLLLAGILSLKPAGDHNDMLRNRVLKELMHLLNRLQVNQNAKALTAFIRGTSDTGLKIEAFIRLPTKSINAVLLRKMADLDMHPIPDETLKRLFLKIQACGWRTTTTLRRFPCPQCDARGRLPFIYLIDHHQGHETGASVPCYECGGTGTILLKTVSCRLDSLEPILFRIPPTTPDRKATPKKQLPDADSLTN